MISRLRASANLGGGAALFVALSFVNALNFLFHLVVARRMSTADYGALAAALGLLLVALVPINALQAVVTAEIARRSAAGSRVILRGLLARAWLLGLGVIALLALLAVPLARFLHLGQALVVVLIGFAVLPTMVSLPARAALLGTLRYRPVAAAVAVGAAVRLGTAWYLAGTGRGVVGGIAASVFGEGVTAVVLLLAARAHFDPASALTNLATTWRDAANAIAAFGGFWLMTGIDTMLARHYLPADTSGQYAAAATVSKAVLFLPAVVALVVFPRFARAPDERSARRLLTAPLVAVAAVGLVATVVLWALRDPALSGLYGPRYLASAPVLGALALGAALLGVGNVLLQYLVARRRRAALLIWAGPVATGAGALVWHDSMAVLAGVLLAGVAASVAGLYAGSRAFRPEPVPVAGALVDLVEPTVDVTVVVPFRSAGPRLRDTVARLCRTLDEEGVGYEVIAVCEAPGERGRDALDGMGPAVRVVEAPAGAGKGHALRTGLSASRGRYLGFVDGEGDVDPAMLRPFLAVMRAYEPDVIVGSKRHPMSVVDYPPVRRLYSWGYQRLVRLLFRLDVRDTQTGLKLARRDVLAAALPRMMEKRYAFDLELLVVAAHLGYGRFFEAPVLVRRQFGPTVSLRVVRGMLLDTLAIFYRLRVLGFYDRPHRWAEAAPVSELAPVTT